MQLVSCFIGITAPWKGAAGDKEIEVSDNQLSRSTVPRCVVVIILLQAYAFLLAFIQMNGGVRTDEAKYLLNIPYPHPPAMRWFFDSFGYLPYHELLVRLFVATLIVQSVWFLWPCIKKVRPGLEMIVCVAYLVSGALVLQGGTAMMAVLNGWQGLVLLCIALVADPAHSSAGMLTRRNGRGFRDSVYFVIGLFWLFSLFTGYQAFLYLPAVAWIYWKSPLKFSVKLLYVCAPVVLLSLYSFTNPLALARMIGTAEKDVGLTVSTRLLGYMKLWSIAGSGIASILGTLGLLSSKRWDLIGSFLLVSIYITMSNSAYYGILLVPLFAVGLAFLPMTVKSQKLLRFVGIPIMILVTASNFALPQQNQARTIGQYFEKANYGSVWHKTKPIARALVVGPFGHEYQYYLPFEIVKYSDVLQDMSQEIIICNEKCPSVLIEGKKLLLKEPVEVYSL